MRGSMIVACLLAGMAVGAEEWSEARVRALERRALETVADLALVPPKLITSPGPEYGAANERWAMNNGAALTPKGRLWTSWIGGGDSPDAYTVCAFSDDNGATWGKPALVVDGHDPKRIPFPRSNIIANLWTDPVGKLHLFVSQSMWHNDGRMGVWETVCANPDEAKPAWSPIRRICDGAALNKPVVLRNGTWLLPVELPRAWGPWKGLFGTSETDAGALALASTDGGATWERRGTAMVPDSDWPENHILELKDGTLRMYMRSRPGLRMTESRDEGRTWGPVTKPDGMDQPCARCQVRALASGNWIFVKHLSSPDSYNENKRIGQIAYLSRDEGKTWEGGLVLDERKSVTYPDVEQGPDGLIYVTHDFERGREAEIILHTFTEEDILAKKFQSPKSRQGIVVMKAMGTKHNQKKYKAKAAMSLGVIDRQAYFRFASSFFRKAGRILPEETFRAAYDRFEGITWYVQSVMKALYASEIARPTEKDVADAVVHLVEENAMNYGFILSKCTQGAVELLRAVAAERVVPEPMSAEFGRRHGLRAASSVRFALDSLLEDELLYKRDDGYVVYDRLFAEWLRN